MFTCPICGKIPHTQVQWNTVYSTTDAYNVTVAEVEDGTTFITVQLDDSYPGDSEDEYFDCHKCGRRVECIGGYPEVEYD